MVSNHQALVVMDMDKNDWLRDSEFASIYETAIEDTSSLSPVQLRQFSTFVANAFNAWEFAFITHDNGMMNEDIWNGWDGFYRTELKQMGYLWFWNQGREGFSPEFRSYVDSILAED